MKAHLAFVNSLVSFCDILNQQPEVVGELMIYRVSRVNDKSVCSYCQQLKLLALLRLVSRVNVEYPTNP